MSLKPTTSKLHSGFQEDSSTPSVDHSPSKIEDLATGITHSSPVADNAPDGGLSAWLVVLGVWCTSFCSFGWLNSIGIFQEYYQNTLLRNYSASTVSWIPSLQIFFIMSMGPIVGIIYDKSGPQMLIAIGSILHVFGVMMTSLGKEYYQILLAQGVCSAIGVSAIFQPSLNCIHGWFDRNRGAAFGILATGSSLGGVIFPIMVTHLIQRVGYGWAMRISGFLILFLLIIANITIRPFKRPQFTKITGQQMLQPFKEADFILLATGFFCLTYGVFVPINYLPVQAQAAGMSTDLAQYLIPILNAASLFGRLFSGIIGDKSGRFNIFILVCYITAILMLALWIPATSNAAIIVFAALFGFSSGAYISLIAPLVMQISPMAEIGFRTGVIFFVNSIAGLTTSPINGAIMDGSSGMLGIKIFSGAFCFVGTTFILAVRVRHVGWKMVAVF